MRENRAGATKEAVKRKTLAQKMHKLQIVENHVAVSVVSCIPPHSCSLCSEAGRQCQRRDRLFIWPKITIFLYYRGVGMKINVC